jgi:hypothetical protein
MIVVLAGIYQQGHDLGMSLWFASDASRVSMTVWMGSIVGGDSAHS